MEETYYFLPPFSINHLPKTCARIEFWRSESPNVRALIPVVNSQNSLADSYRRQER